MKMNHKEILEKIKVLRENPVFNYTMLALLGIGAGLVSMLLGASIFGMSMFRVYLGSAAILALNLAPPVLLIFLVYFISGRAWIAFTFPTLFIYMLSMVQYFKLQLRGDPFIVTDFIIAGEAGTILAAYSPTISWSIYFAVLSFVCGVLFSVFLLKYKEKKPRIRIIAAVATLAVSATLYMLVYTSETLYARVPENRTKTEWRPVRNYIEKGFIYPFIHSIKKSTEDMSGRYPDWYDEQEAQRLLASYADADIPNDKKVNIITIALESYADMSWFDVLDFSIDIYEPFHRIQEESVSGKLIVNVFSGATIDTERLFLTGNTHLTQYRSSTNSFVHYLRSQGYHTEGLHAGDLWFYDRRPINAMLGFDRYYFIEDFSNGNRSDAFLFSTVTKLYEARDKNKPYFGFHLSYQNHGAYDATKTKEPYVINQGEMSDESYFILNNYLAGIYDTTERIDDFIESLRFDAEPVVVLIFGDHMPWLGNQNSVYHELGINIDRETDEGFLNYYSTPFFIWANETAKKTLGNDFKGECGSFSPAFLMGTLFDLCSWPGEGYMQALREFQETVDVINTALGVFRENGELKSGLSPEASAAYQRLRMMEIYRRSNFFY